MPALSAESRLRRLLALVPWVVARDGPTLAEVCARFGCTKKELIADLELLFCCGLYPYTPDQLIEVDIADGRVWIRYADFFSRPLRLTPAEGLALLAAGRTQLAVGGADPEGPLARGLTKLAAVLGVGDEAGLEIEVNHKPGPVLEAFRHAVIDHRQVMIEYYSFGRDQFTTRIVNPYAVFTAAGQWYVSAWCHSANAERLFRIDRVQSATMLDATFAVSHRAPTSGPPELTIYHARPGDPRVVIELGTSSRWVIEHYPVEDVVELRDGRLRVTLVASERAWLERLLLRLGPDARVIEGDIEVGRAAANRLLARYRQNHRERTL
jgi:predicted DNA-binding transcriptional regulator YafY